MNYKYILKLSLKFIKSHKTLFIPFIIVIFLSTCLITTIYVIKDSYAHYSLQMNQKIYGAWDFTFPPQSIEGSEEIFIDNNVDIKMFENYLSYVPISNEIENHLSNFKAVSTFDYLPIIILEGMYPTNEHEILIDIKYMEQSNLSIGNIVAFHDESNVIKNFTITGYYQHYIPTPTITFYTYLENNHDAFTAYADAKDQSSMQHIMNMTETMTEPYYQLNDGVINAKYHFNDSFEILYTAFMGLVYICIFLFIFNSLSMYIKKKQSYFYQLSTLGATKKQIILSLFFEFIIVCGFFFSMSVILSISLWRLIFMFGGKWIANYLDLSFDFTFVLTTNHLYTLLFMSLVIFLFCFIIALWTNRQQKRKKFKFKTIKLRFIPLTFRMVCLEMIRTGYAIFIIATLIVSSVLFQTTQVIVDYWINSKVPNIQQDSDISASFNLLNKDKNDISNFTNEIEKICVINNAKSCNLLYGVEANAIIGYNTTFPVYSVNQGTYNKFLKKQKIKDTNIPIFVHGKNDENINDELTIHILTLFQEEIDNFTMNYLIIEDDKFMRDYHQEAMVLVPPALTLEWLEKYPDTAVSGTLEINSENHINITNQLSSIPKTNANDQIYVIDNTEELGQFYRDTGAIRIFVYVLNFSILILTLFIIYNILLQYNIKNKREIELLTALGMTKRKVRIFFIERAILITGLSASISFLLEIIALVILNQWIKIEISPMSVALYSFIYTSISMIVIIIISLLILKRFIFMKKRL
ncbi:MAG: FtsX-like permease family protein [Longicatena sp.]